MSINTRNRQHPAGESGSPIGEMAQRAGVSTRTLRYYEELGLLSPSGHSSGGARRYSDATVERLSRIKELQELMGLNLDEIRTILDAEDRLLALKAEYRSGRVAARRREQIVREAIEINADLRSRVSDRVANMKRFLDELEAKAERYAAILAESAGEKATR